MFATLIIIGASLIYLTLTLFQPHSKPTKQPARKDEGKERGDPVESVHRYLADAWIKGDGWVSGFYVECDRYSFN